MTGIIKRQILDLLKTEGPMDHHQIAERLSLSIEDIQGPIKSLAWSGCIVKYHKDRKRCSVWAFKTAL